MTALQPTPLATWLLRCFATSARHEPLIGDLAEEYRAGRSSFWYWRQVLVAIVVISYREIRTQRRLALRALITTFVIYHLLWLFAVRAALMEIQRAGFWMFAGPHGSLGGRPTLTVFTECC